MTPECVRMARCVWTFLVMLCITPQIKSGSQSTKTVYPRLRLSHKGKATGVCVEVWSERAKLLYMFVKLLGCALSIGHKFKTMVFIRQQLGNHVMRVYVALCWCMHVGASKNYIHTFVLFFQI